MIKVIFFDFDGVIVESVDIKTRAFAKLFEHEGEAVVKKVIDYHLNNGGVSRYEKFKYIYREILKHPLTENMFQILCDKFASLVVDSVIEAPYVQGVQEFLENYSLDYKCYIVSATPQNEIDEIIQRRGIKQFFKSIYGAPTKKADAVRNILISERIEPAYALYIGDALSDYAAANDNSVNFIARINGNKSIFIDITCLKVKDLRSLNKICETL